MTLLNIDENIRFKEFGLKFWACLPVYDYNSGTGSRSKKAARALALHHEAMRVLSRQLMEFCKAPQTMRFPDGLYRACEARLAFIAGDYQEVQKHHATSGSGCNQCRCPKQEMDATGRSWRMRRLADVMKSLYLVADECLDDEGCVVHGKRKVIDEWEEKTGSKFLVNGFSELQEIGFDVLQQCPREVLHHLVIGLFWEHIVKASVQSVTDALSASVYWVNRGPGRPALMNDTKMNRIWTRLWSRTSAVNEDEAAFNFRSPSTADVFAKVYRDESPTLEGDEIHALMLALPVCLRSLIKEEVIMIASLVPFHMSSED